MPNSPLIGIDTSFLLAHTLQEHENHKSARTLLASLLEKGQKIALCPIVVDEFLHVVTDPKRFRKPVTMATALTIAETWIRSRESEYFPPSEDSALLQLKWLREYRLGRRRIHDTSIAAIYATHGVRQILTNNVSDFETFGMFEILTMTSAIHQP